jgi:hypothetical protein
MNKDILKTELCNKINFNTTALVLLGYLLFVALTPLTFNDNLFFFLVGVTFCFELLAEFFRAALIIGVMKK